MSLTSWPLWVLLAFVCMFGLFYWIDRINISTQKKFNFVSEKLDQLSYFKENVEEKESARKKLDSQHVLALWASQRKPEDDEEKNILYNKHHEAYGSFLRNTPVDLTYFIDRNPQGGLARLCHGDVELSYYYFNYTREAWREADIREKISKERLVFYENSLKGYLNLEWYIEKQEYIDGLLFELWEQQLVVSKEYDRINTLLREKRKRP